MLYQWLTIFCNSSYSEIIQYDFADKVIENKWLNSTHFVYFYRYI